MAAICGTAQCDSPGTIVRIDGCTRILCDLHYRRLMAGLIDGRRERVERALRGEVIEDLQTERFVVANRDEIARYLEATAGGGSGK
jgi:hypothetical protein